MYLLPGYFIFLPFPNSRQSPRRPLLTVRSKPTHPYPHPAVSNMTLPDVGVVSVSINYRLGVPGFLALEVLSKADERGVR